MLMGVQSRTINSAANLQRREKNGEMPRRGSVHGCFNFRRNRGTLEQIRAMWPKLCALYNPKHHKNKKIVLLHERK
jgi:hypothetical protein